MKPEDSKDANLSEIDNNTTLKESVIEPKDHQIRFQVDMLDFEAINVDNYLDYGQEKSDSNSSNLLSPLPQEFIKD